jgi:hypothetical protein
MVGLLKFAFLGGGGFFFCIVRVMVYRGGGKEKYVCFGFRVYHNV